jgi:hypothetical protein
MVTTFLTAAMLLQGTPRAPAPPPAMIAIDELPIENAAAARCAVAYATIGHWQKTGDVRGKAYPDVAARGGREFFVQVMAKLIDTGLTRENIAMIAAEGLKRNDTPEGTEQVARMMPACEMMKAAAGL